MSKSSKTNRSMTNFKDPKSAAIGANGNPSNMTFNEWVKRKDAEKRMK